MACKRKRKGPTPAREPNPGRREMTPCEKMVFEQVVAVFGSRDLAIDAINSYNPWAITTPAPRVPKRAKQDKR